MIEAGNSPETIAIFPKTYWHSSWKSLESFSRHVQSMDKSKAWDGTAWSSEQRDFFGISMPDALKLAENGWKEGVEKVDKLSKLIYALNPEFKRPIAYGVAGSTPNVARAIAGNPLNMRLVEPASSRKRPVLTIVANMCESSGTKAEHITSKAATLIAVIDQIEAKGYGVEIIALAQTNTNYRSEEKGDYSTCYITSVKIKEAHHPMDVARLAFGIGHVGMFRRLVFADWGYSQHTRGIGSHFGYVSQIHSNKILQEQHIYVIPKGVSDFKDDETCADKGVKWIINNLKKQGCPAFTKDHKFNYTITDDDED
jgi:hypothetical protein